MLAKPENHINQKELDGLVWILNGRVLVRDEIKNGMPPIINPCNGVKMYINGLEYNHLSNVNEKDIIELKPVDTEINFNFDVEISEDKVKAYATYTPPKIVKNAIVDTNPVNKLDVQVTQVVIEMKEVSKQQLIEYLKDVCDVNFGIIDSVLEDICKNNTPGRFLIAEGIPVKESIGDWIEYYFEDNNSTEISLQEDENGKVDFKNILDYKTVSQGQVIAQFHKCTTGIDGKAVNGDVIAAKQSKRLTILPTFSVKFDNNAGTITALKSGRPSKQVKGDSVTFQIYDTISIGEVSIKTGNIKYKGDIEVKESVYESMEVIARQNVLIKGNVNFASVFAGNNITVKGAVISSKINAAMSDSIAKDPAPLMSKLVDGINSLIANMNSFSYNEITANNLKVVPNAIRYLLNTKNKDLPNTVYDILNALRKGNYDIEEDFILEFMKKTRALLGNYSDIEDVQYLNDVVSDLEALFLVKDNTKIKGNVTLSTVLNSEVWALGDVIVSGKGCFNSKIYSKSKVKITSDLRGGEVRAEKGIEVYIAGSKMGVKTLLVVPEDSYINIKVAHSDITIKIGGASHTFLSEKSMVRAKLLNGKLLF